LPRAELRDRTADHPIQERRAVVGVRQWPRRHGDTEKLAQRLPAVCDLPHQAYALKEAVSGIFEPGLSLEDVTLLIDRLLSRLARSRLEPFVRLGKTIRKHRDGILSAIRLGINQGRTEALNNKVRLMTRRAYGFHSAKAALALIMLTCGPITLHLPHELHALGIG
jgi:transposase